MEDTSNHTTSRFERRSGSGSRRRFSLAKILKSQMCGDFLQQIDERATF